MKIVILGAGQVGGSVAHILASEANDVTVVDANAERLQILQDRLDIRTLAGHASHPAILEQAGMADADMLIALTDNDEVNMIACQVAYTLFNTPRRIARVRSGSYLSYQDQLLNDQALPIDVLISPEQLVTDYIQRIIEHPGALQVLDFAEGQVRLMGVKAYEGSSLVGQALRTLPDRMPGIETRVAAIFRQGRPIMPEGNTLIEADDEVFFIAARKDARAIVSELRKLDRMVKRLIIAGGGHIGTRLAQGLEDRFQVKVIEHNPVTARRLSEQLSRAIVLQGDAADENLLRQENIENMDVFCAVTNDDEANILSAMLAKRMGAHKVMALINRVSYVDLVESSGIIDVAISPQQATIGSLLAHVRRGDVAKVHSLRRGAAEAIEAVAHGDYKTSKVVGRRVDEIRLPPGTTIGAVAREDEVIICHHDTMIQAEDHVILFLIDKKRVPEVERLFSPAATFL
ncbi:MAG TPA: Trk system potassium transporter TrkA [Candidatus Competibacteraceae bacterium]|nr:Trk system potassium transporter TrkA [Gammaproteobacteria bacterium]HPF59245.1 Trk system potassium transporter TrkA [Candidatus Competibacteraceae bacterium]HRY18659.1 Trk system potassium transporter TrkA [Candidatus Competibacteraceae bacterium]